MVELEVAEHFETRMLMVRIDHFSPGATHHRFLPEESEQHFIRADQWRDHGLAHGVVIPYEEQPQPVPRCQHDSTKACIVPKECVFGRPPFVNDELPRVPRERDEAEQLELQFREWCREITDEIIEKQIANRSAATTAERDSSLVYDLQLLEKTIARVEKLQLRSTLPVHNE